MMPYDVGDDDNLADEELQRALELSRAEAPPPPPPQPAQPAQPADVVVLGQIPSKFRVYAASAAGHNDLDSTGRILLPSSCLAVFSSFLGEMPPTLLLRLVGDEGSHCCVGVAEFIDDKRAADMIVQAVGPRARDLPLPRLFDRGPLAVCFVPRWARGALIVDPLTPEASLQIVTLPLATHMLLRPHTDEFAAALAASGDIKTTLTDVMNRFPAISKGAVLGLQLGGTTHIVDVLGLKGLRHVRCGTADVARPTADVAGEGASEAVPAACLVDADVELDFAPSVEADAKAAAAAKRAQAQAEAALAQAQAAALAQAQQGDPFSAVNAGRGHVLGAGAESVTASGSAAPTEAAPMSDREKRLAALARRGL